MGPRLGQASQHLAHLILGVRPHGHRAHVSLRADGDGEAARRGIVWRLEHRHDVVASHRPPDVPDGHTELLRHPACGFVALHGVLGVARSLVRPGQQRHITRHLIRLPVVGLWLGLPPRVPNTFRWVRAWGYR